MKISTKLVSASAVALLALSSSTSVLAVTSTTAQDATSNGKITLQVDPNTDHPGGGDDGGDGDDNGELPGDGNGNDNTGNTGDFTLDVVPNYDFGIRNIPDGAATYNALFWDKDNGLAQDPDTLAETRLANPYVQVTDLRENNTGWHVTVAMTQDFQTSAGKALNGAVLTLPEAAASNATPVDSSNTSAAPTTSKVAVNSDAAVLMSAADGAGIGSWMDIMFDNKDANTLATTLDVPAGNSAGAYQADLTWTLADTPTQA